MDMIDKRDFIKLYRAREFEACITAAKVGMVKHPEDYTALGYTALSLSQLNRYDEAIPYFNQYLERDASSMQVWFLRGECHQQIRHFDQAIHDFSICIRLAPDQWEVYDKIGICYFDRGDEEEAIQWLKYSYEKSLDPESLIILVSMLKRTGKRDEAFQYARMGAKKFPEDDRFTDFVSELSHSE